MWEDGWLDFLDTLLEFSTQWLEGPLLRIWVSPNTHMKEVKDCANMLAVVEKCTGMFLNNIMFLETLSSSFCCASKSSGMYQICSILVYFNRKVLITVFLGRFSNSFLLFIAKF